MDVFAVVRVLGDENRWRIVQLLSEKSRCVCELVEGLQIPQNLVSHHLTVLKTNGIVSDCRCGKKNYYTLNREILLNLSDKLKELGETNEEC